MGNLKETLDTIEGATEVFFCAYDGMILERATKGDIDLVAARCASAHKYIKVKGEEFKEMICIFDSYFLVVRWLEDGFIGVVMGLDGNIGRAKLELNKYGSRFYK